MRCNIISPIILTDQHLVAEFRELIIPIGMNKIYGQPNLKVVPSDFKLNKGHINFFRVRPSYLYERWLLVKGELINRGFNPRIEFPLLENNQYDFSFIPTKKDKKIIIDRIVEKIQLKPQYYRLNKTQIDSKQYVKQLIELYNNDEL